MRLLLCHGMSKFKLNSFFLVPIKIVDLLLRNSFGTPGELRDFSVMQVEIPVLIIS